MVVGLIIGLLGRHIIIGGVKRLANTSTGKKLQTYIINTTAGELYKQLNTYFKITMTNLKYEDNSLLYNIIFNLSPYKTYSLNEKISSVITFNFYNTFITDIGLLLSKNIEIVNRSKGKIEKLKHIKQILSRPDIFYDLETNKFLNYLINQPFKDFIILLYYYPENNVIYFEFNIDNNNRTIRKFTYEQLKNNFYKITLCLLENNNNKISKKSHYNNIILLYSKYFIDGISKNFILLKENEKLKTYHLIESEDMSNDEDHYRENGIINALEKFKSKSYSAFINYFKKISDEYGIKASDEIVKKIGESTSKSGGVKNNENNENIDFLKYILYNYDNSSVSKQDDIDEKNMFSKKYEYIKQKTINKKNIFFGVIVTYDIIDNKDDSETIPSIQINFLNQINKSMEEINISLNEEKEINKVSKDSKNININKNLLNNIRNEINQNFINEIIENFDLNNLLDNINFNILMFDEKYPTFQQYHTYNNKDIKDIAAKQNINRDVKSNFLKKNGDYSYNICININKLFSKILMEKNNSPDKIPNKFIYKHKLNINYSNTKFINKCKIEDDIKKYCDIYIKNLNKNFRLYLLKNNDLNTFFTNLIGEGCNIQFVINNNNIYILIDKNEKVVVLDCFSVYSLFSFTKNFYDIYYKTSNAKFINYIRNNNIFDKKQNYTFDKLFQEYNKPYCSILDSMAILKELNERYKELIITFDDGLINLTKLKKQLLKFSSKTLTKSELESEKINIDNIFYNLNTYNRNLYNFFINQHVNRIKLVIRDNFLYIRVKPTSITIHKKKHYDIELNLFKILFINNNFILEDLYEIDSSHPIPKIMNLNNKKFKNKYSFYTIDDIKSVKDNIFNIDYHSNYCKTHSSVVSNKNTFNNNKNNNNNTNLPIEEIPINIPTPQVEALLKNNNSIILDIYTYIDTTYLDKIVILNIEDNKIKIYNPKNEQFDIELTNLFNKLDKLNKYLIRLNKNKNNKFRLRIQCKILYLEIIYKSLARFSSKYPSLLIDLKKFTSKISINKNLKNLTNTNNLFTTLKSFIKTNMSQNLGKRKNNYTINNKC